MIQLEKKNLSGIKLPGGTDFDDWLNKSVTVLKKNKLVPAWEGPKSLLELYFVEKNEIRKLNKKFLGKNKETDVLSFSFMEGDQFPGDNLLGQIFIAPSIAKKQARDHGLSWREELEFLFVHGLLHVFGLDHEKAADFEKMFKLHAQIMPDQKWGNFVEKIYQEYFGRD